MAASSEETSGSRASGSLSSIHDTAFKTTGGPAWYKNWQQEALRNMTDYEESLFEKTLFSLKEKARKRCSEAGSCNDTIRFGFRPEPQHHSRYQLMQSFISCPRGGLKRFPEGIEDGGKWLCFEVLEKPDCVVYSLGSGGNKWKYKERMNGWPRSLISFVLTLFNPPLAISS